MINPVNQLDKEKILAFWNRKPRNGRQLGRLDLVVNVALDKHYLVPKNQEHKDFVPQIPCDQPSELVPYWMQLKVNNDKYSLLQLVVGGSSYEAEHEIRHSMSDLSRAHQLAQELIARSQAIVLDTPVKSRILKVYATP